MQAIDEALAISRSALRPPKKLSLSEWAENNFRLSSEASSEPGRYKVSRASYQKEMLDVLSNEPDKEIVIYKTSAQIGKTTLQLITLLYYMSQEPSPILMVNPTLEMSKAFSKERLTPALRDSVGMQNVLAENKGKESGNNILNKTFNGGHLALVGSNSTAGLASRPIRVVMADEISRFPNDGGEGDPVQLAIRRTANFHNRRIVLASTPTDAGTCPITSRYEESDQRSYYHKCQHCEEFFEPKWENVHWDKDEAGNHLPETALLFCPHCGSGHTDSQRQKAIREGKWVCKFPERPVAGFHLNALSSPWATLEALVRDFISCAHDFARMKVFRNTVLGLENEDTAQDLDDLNLIARVEDYDSSNIPESVSVLTCGSDVQGDRVESLILGHAPNDETYVIEHNTFVGSPSDPELWQSVKEWILKPRTRADGTQLKVVASAFDSGGHHTQTVYAFCKANAHNRFLSIKGRQGNIPIFAKRPSQTDLGKVWLVGVDSAKDKIYEALKVDSPGPGYVHFPITTTADNLAQLTSEKKIIKTKNGYSYWVWNLPSGRRNEFLDCFVYALSAFVATQLDPAKQQRKLEKRQEAAKNDTLAEVPSTLAEVKDTLVPQTPAKARKIQMRRPARQASWL